MALSNILKVIIKYTFLLYTGYRNWLFMAVISGSDPVLQALGVVATEGALIFWDYYTRHTEDGSYPRVIAMLMTGVSLIAVLVGVFGHIEIHAYQQLGIELPRYVIDNTIMAIVGIIGLNLCAVVACEHLSDAQLARSNAIQNGERPVSGGGIDLGKALSGAAKWLGDPVAGNVTVPHKNGTAKAEPVTSDNTSNPT